MRLSSQLLVTAGLLLFAALNALASDVKIIVNASVKADSISSSELKSVFLLQRKSLKEGSAVIPVLEKSGPTHQAFLKRYLNRDSEEIRIYYQGLVFTGKGTMPKELNSDEEVVAYVARTRGAIGYVSTSASTQGVRVLAVSEESEEGRALLTRVEPEYPDTLQHLGIGGVVRLELAVSPRGSVEKIVVLGGNPILAEAAMKAAKQWIYAPSASPSKIQVKIPFGPQP